MTWAALVRDPARTLLALDFDGTLAPIVQDPTRAFIHTRSAAALQRIAQHLGQVAIVTGRPVAQVQKLASFDRSSTPEGLVIFGQYGVEWWDSATGDTIEPEPSPAIALAAAEIPGILEDCGVPGALIEDKRIAVAVHTRGLEPDALARLTEPMEDLARRHNLWLEPGRHVLELRLPQSDKGLALRALVERLDAQCVIYAGDDLGDLPAFAVADEFRAARLETLTIAVASSEQAVMAQHADTSVPSTDGFADWLEAYAEALESSI